MRLMPSVRTLTEAESIAKAAAVSLAKEKGYNLRWIRDWDWNRPHVAAIDPATGDRCAWASHWGGILEFLKHARRIDDGTH